jgi:hypothetical protein
VHFHAGVAAWLGGEFGVSAGFAEPLELVRDLCRLSGHLLIFIYTRSPKATAAPDHGRSRTARRTPRPLSGRDGGRMQMHKTDVASATLALMTGRPGSCRAGALRLFGRPQRGHDPTLSQHAVNPGPTATAQAAVPPEKDAAELWKAVWDLCACRRRDCADAVLPRHPPPGLAASHGGSAAQPHPQGHDPRHTPAPCRNASRKCRMLAEEGATKKEQGRPISVQLPACCTARTALPALTCGGASTRSATLSGCEALHNICWHPAVAAGATRGDAAHPADRCCGPPFLAGKALARRAM